MLVASCTKYQISSHPDEVNCNVHETQLTMYQDTEITRKPRNFLEENTCGNLKSIIYVTNFRKYSRYIQETEIFSI